MNHNADQRKINNDSGKKKGRDGFGRQKARPLLVLGWIAVGITCIVLVIFFFFPRLDFPIAGFSNLKRGSKVFRTKIPEEIKNAANLYRGKIPVVDQPVKQKLPPQPTIAAAEQVHPKKETEFHTPIEPKIANVKKPTVAKVVPSQPVMALPEQGDPEQETEPRLPKESPTIPETKPLVANALPSQPTIAPAEKNEPRQEVEPHQLAASPTIGETKPSVANALPSQPTIAPAEKSEPPQEAEPHQPVASQVKMEAMLPAEESPVSSQVVVSPPEPKEQLKNADPRQAEVRPQPEKEDFKGETEERTIHGETWLLSQKSSHYTIQIMGVRKEALLFDFVESAQLLKQNEIAYYRTTFKDKPWFRLLYGVYSTKKDAQSAADAFPPKIRKSSPWIRRLSGVQKAIRKNSSQ
jgi:hypothetical protein